ncbi:hypothetical protein FNJ88_05360 [Chryseobacterium sp. SNU WT5]|uniref:hypothetical protein n=1 Tax=Chryseobacterium sp. SNU WT5 TaxID=2594269 RepID=UPI00117F6C42|nr:hypothetical protein [Chryseobacterium sp. SNU WT5]QDP85012.1 hypothetical protein FNJ88_05360 [Chryseobacterium sp. SNU WT5]
MKNFILLSFIFLSTFLFGQNVVLSKVVKTHSNTDKIFYRLDSVIEGAEYLGELEVQGFSDNDVEVFNKIYKKAKEIGANSFRYQPFEKIDGSVSEFDFTHYKLSLYYLDAHEIPKENNIVYIIGSPYKKQKISINQKNITLEPRTYTKLILEPAQIYTISTRNILGSTIKVGYQENQVATYFQVSGFSVNSNSAGEPGINLKSGDIVRLEQSYAQFLTTIYQLLK